MHFPLIYDKSTIKTRLGNVLHMDVISKVKSVNMNSNSLLINHSAHTKINEEGDGLNENKRIGDGLRSALKYR